MGSNNIVSAPHNKDRFTAVASALRSMVFLI